MGNYSVPESIRKMKPAGTMVKNISGYYYVYEYKTIVDENGNRKTAMGKNIGSIKPEKGFIPNDNYARDVEMTSLEFGQYAVVLANSRGTLQSNEGCHEKNDRYSRRNGPSGNSGSVPQNH